VKRRTLLSVWSTTLASLAFALTATAGIAPRPAAPTANRLFGSSSDLSTEGSLNVINQVEPTTVRPECRKETSHVLRRLIQNYYDPLSRQQAIERESARIPDPGIALDGAANRLAASEPAALPLGRLPNDHLVRVDQRTLFQSGLLQGASGSGKTRLILQWFMTLLRWSLGLPAEGLAAPPDFRIEAELADAKFETFSELQARVALLWQSLTDELRERLARMIRVIDFSPTHVAAFAPYDNRAGLVSGAFLSRLRADVLAQVGPYTVTAQMHQLLYMYGWLLTDLAFPPNDRLADRVFRDIPFRRRLLERVPDPDLRLYFWDLEHRIARQTVDALLRRIQFSFPEVKRAIGIPPRDLDRFNPGPDVRFVFGNYGQSRRMTLPPSIGFERLKHRVVDVQLGVPRRDRSIPGVCVLEEVGLYLPGDTSLIETLMTSTRAHRAFGFGLIYCTQDPEGIDKSLWRTLGVNSRWAASFRSPLADEFFQHLTPSSGLNGVRSDAERRRTFAREMANLPRQHFIFHAKGEPALPLRTLDVPDLDRLLGDQSEDELVDLFNREIAARTMIPNAVADDLIARFEAEVVDRLEVPPPPVPAKREPARTFRELLSQLDALPEPLEDAIDE